MARADNLKVYGLGELFRYHRSQNVLTLSVGNTEDNQLR